MRGKKLSSKTAVPKASFKSSFSSMSQTQSMSNMTNQASNINNYYMPVQYIYNQIQTLARQDHFKQHLEKQCEFERFQKSLDIKSMEGQVEIKILTESLNKKSLLKKNLVLNFASETDLAHFRIKITSPIFFLLTVKSARVVIKKESKPAPGESKQFGEGKAVILTQVFQIIGGKVQKSSVAMLQQTPILTMLQKPPSGPIELKFEQPKNPTYLYFSVGLTKVQKWTTINLGEIRSD